VESGVFFSLLKGTEQMATTVIIELDFETDDVSDADVYTYLDELMENEYLSWEIKEKN
jgi:hypothetical protein